MSSFPSWARASWRRTTCAGSRSKGWESCLSRSSAGEVCAIAATCNHFSGPLEAGDRQGDTVVCPLHNSRFDLCSGEVIDGPAVFPQSRYETRVRDGKIEVKAAAENVQKKVR